MRITKQYHDSLRSAPQCGGQPVFDADAKPFAGDLGHPVVNTDILSMPPAI